MTIPFQQIPANLQVPLFFAELDPSHANTETQVQRTLIIGQVVASGQNLTPNVPDISSGTADAVRKAGGGSMLALMTAAYRAFDTTGEVWYGPLADNGSGVKATGTITIGGVPTASGTLSLYIGGQLVQVGITAGMTTTQAATAVKNAIQSNLNLPVSASASVAVVSLTANNAGECGNDIDLRFNYKGYRSGEVIPAGLSPTIVQMASGATNPLLTTLLTNCVDQPFDFIISPYVDSVSIAAISAFLSDNGGRWSWSTQVYGHCFIAYRGTFSQITSQSATLNDQHLSMMGLAGSPMPYWIWAAAYGAAAAVSVRADPAQPIRGLAMPAVLPPNLISRFSLGNRNTLLNSGVSTFAVDQAGNVSTERLVTTYQTDQFGNPDNAYQSLETMFTLMAVLRTLKLAVISNFSRSKLADDGTRFAPGSNIVTPSTIRGTLIAAYRDMEYNGLVQNSAAFAAALVVQRNASNPNRVDVLYPADLIDQLDVFAALVQFVNG